MVRDAIASAAPRRAECSCHCPPALIVTDSPCSALERLVERCIVLTSEPEASNSVLLVLVLGAFFIGSSSASRGGGTCRSSPAAPRRCRRSRDREPDAVADFVWERAVEGPWPRRYRPRVMSAVPTGTFACVCYAGEELYHERLVAAWVSESHYVVVSPDHDLFLEQLRGLPREGGLLAASERLARGLIGLPGGVPLSGGP